MYRSTDGGSPRAELVAVAIALVLAWSISPLFGGQAHVPPLWFAVPILWAAWRFDRRTTLVVVVLSCVLAGPLTPADVATGASQRPEVWLVRSLFFAVVGLMASRQAALFRTAASQDPLTGLLNRGALAPRLTAALRRSRRDGHALALVCLDLDEFKVVNDSFGHATGDAVLRAVGDRLRSATRAGDVIARQGGDEFIVILPRLSADLPSSVAADRAETAVKRLVEAFEAPFQIGDLEFDIGCSAGFSLFPDDASDAETLHRHADAAMYSAKSGGGGHQRYVPSAREPLARASRAARLRSAVGAGDLELHYQPIFAVGGPIMGVEALVRWRDGDAGMVPPSEFIPIAEECGIIEALGEWVLATLCAQAGRWAAEGLKPKIGFNVAPRELRRPGFAHRVLSALEAGQLDPERIVIEVTESAWTLGSDHTLPTLSALRAAGVKVAIDDFGAGYSSLARLRELPVDVIKVDRALLHGVPERGDAVAVMAAIFDLAAACGADVVAEGVETEAQYAFLRERGCQLAQGYWLARPADAEEVTRWLREQLASGRRTAAASLAA